MTAGDGKFNMLPAPALVTLAQACFAAMLSESALCLFSRLRQTPSGTTPDAAYRISNSLVIRVQLYYPHAPGVRLESFFNFHLRTPRFTRQLAGYIHISSVSPSRPILQKPTPAASAYSFIRQADSKPPDVKCMGTRSPVLNLPMNWRAPRV